MKTSSALLHTALPLLLIAIFLPSCAKMSQTVKNFDFQDIKMPNFRKLLPGKQSNIPIVQVRPEDLEKMPDGEAKALAYLRQRREIQAFSMPRDFKPETLPADAGMPSFGILPPLTPGGSTGMDFDEPIPKLDDLNE